MLLFIGILLGMILIILLIAPMIAHYIYKILFQHRAVKEKDLKYFTPEELDLKKESFTFLSGKNELKGYYYYVPNISYQAIVIFAHGMGGGHLAYIKEIQYFARNGFLVIGYDNTGHGESMGEKMEGFSQGICDLNALITKVSQEKDYPIILCGHSWGAYNVLNANLENITAVVAISSFNHPAELLNEIVRQKIHFSLPFLQESFQHIEKRKFHMYKISLESLRQSTIPILIVHGKEDNVVSLSSSYALFKGKLSYKENIQFYLVEERFHRPLITEEAALYDFQVNIDQEKLNKIKNKEEQEKAKKEFYTHLDYELMTQFDEKVMQDILTFIQKSLKKQESN